MTTCVSPKEPPRAPDSRHFIIPVFIPHAGCPHRCAFCNQTTLSGVSSAKILPKTIRARVSEFIRYRRAYHSPVQISFYGGNFLGIEPTQLCELLETASTFVSDGLVDSLRFSTRPDTITPDTLDIIAPFPVRTIELGVQSLDNQILKQSHRGHTAADSIQAFELLRKHRYEIGLQMMIGLPGDDGTASLDTTRNMLKLDPDFVRIYPTAVLKNSRLEKWYQQGTYQPMSLRAAVSLTKRLYLLFAAHHITVIRMGLQSSQELDNGDSILAGPYHPAFGHLVHSAIFYDMALFLLDSNATTHDVETLMVHPRSLSKMRGLHNSNIRRIETRLGLKLHVTTDPDMQENQLAHFPSRYPISYTDLLPDQDKSNDLPVDIPHGRWY
jgi:histone acetyltransferase (RNA polymerase elongator complex component)